MVAPCEQEQTLQLSTVSRNVDPSGTIVPDTLQAEISNHYVRFAQMIDVKTDNALYIYI